MRLIVALLAFTTAAYAAQPSKCKIEESIRNQFLDFHNEKRKELAAGHVKNFRPAKNMYKLRWSCDLERSANNYIKFCGINVPLSGAYGAMRAQFKASKGYPRPELINTALNGWWKQVEKNHLDEYNRYPNHTRLFGVANIINSETTKIGCSYYVCPTNDNKEAVDILCLYDDVADIAGRYLYDTGSPCTKSEECTTYRKSTCETATGLCVRPEEKPDNGKNTMCQVRESGMTDKVRNTFLDVHNDLRSLVASGNAQDKLVDGGKGSAPQAAKMMKMEYNCDLEKMAAEYARKCIYKHSTDEYRGFTEKSLPAGENLYRVSILDADKVKAAEWATRAWFSELKEVGIGSENNLTRALWDRSKGNLKMQIGHYTQLAWGNTDKIGCSIQQCLGNIGDKRKQTLVVCHYQEIGNRVGKIVYEIGTPCSNCPSGYKCENNLCAKKSRS
ncbi:SCP-like protein [Ancylostoma caninum]|uniref:SCP-like protein n=1 Tax=Ancylostoma caninum TaxID=29170 RepID=A0A368GC93_ANCCA|nr:SCP-like protein [Ancylostoma caninum]